MVTTTANLSSSQAVQFRVVDVITMAWHKARLGPLEQTPNAVTQDRARSMLNAIMDRVQAKARLAKDVRFLEVTTTAPTADTATSHELASSIFDVIGDGMHKFSGDTSETPITFMGRDEYQRITDKAAQGTPSRYYPERQSTILIYPWPVPQQAGDTMTFQVVSWRWDLLDGTNTFDHERYWVQYFTYALAYELASAGSIDLAYCRSLKIDAEGQNGSGGLLAEAIAASKQRGKAYMHIGHHTAWSNRRMG